MHRFYVIAALLLLSAIASGPARANSIDTADPGAVAAFQHGLKVVDFESVPGVTPQVLPTYNTGMPTNPGSRVFDQVSGVQFSVGGEVGVNAPVLFDLSAIGGAHSGTRVLGPVDFDGNTEFGSSGQIEMYFPTKVSSVGFWLNPALGPVEIIAADTNFAFSHQQETTLETAFVTQGHFVGISRPGADIGGFKIISLSSTEPFTIDDLSFGTTAPVPEPGSAALFGLGIACMAIVRRRTGLQRP
jgi:hypothetical protein